MEEVRHKQKGGMGFLKLDMAHCFHQFEIEKARKLFTLRTPKVLYRFKRWVCKAMKESEGVAKIKYSS